MEPVVFTDKGAPPSTEELERALGKAYAHWEAIVRHAQSAAPGATGAWKFYAGGYGWQFKIERRKKALLYMIPRTGRFTAATALSDHAVETMQFAGFPQELIDAMALAKRSSEGTPARVEVRTATDVKTVTRLLTIKLEG